MDPIKVEMFFASVGSKFPAAKLMVMRDQLLRLDDSRMFVVQSVEYKDPTIMLIFSIFLGSLGVDRFMLGETTLGVVKLLTCGGLGVWAIIDWFLIMNRTKELNYQNFCQVAV